MRIWGYEDMIRIFQVAHLSYHFTWVPPFVRVDSTCRTIIGIHPTNVPLLQTRDKSIQLLLNSNARVIHPFLSHRFLYPSILSLFWYSFTQYNISPGTHESIFFSLHKSVNPFLVHPSRHESIDLHIYLNLRQLLSRPFRGCSHITSAKIGGS